MNILSLFDGISCGRVATERSNIKVTNYYASEINEKAIAVSKYNYSGIQHIGNIFDFETWELPKIDLIIGGSPCQNLSSSNVYGDGKGLNGEKSKLFWEYLKVLNKYKPKYFLFENVGSMKNIDKDVITRELGVQPLKINSQLFSAQKRNRLYWTNIPCEIPTERKNIFMEDISETTVPDKYYLKQGTLNCIMSPAKKGWCSGKMEINLEIGRPITASCWRIHRADTDNYISTKYCPDGRTNVRRLTPLECERMQTLPDNYTSILKDKDRYEAIGNGWTVDAIAHIFKGLK